MKGGLVEAEAGVGMGAATGGDIVGGILNGARVEEEVGAAMGAASEGAMVGGSSSPAGK